METVTPYIQAGALGILCFCLYLLWRVLQESREERERMREEAKQDRYDFLHTLSANMESLRQASEQQTAAIRELAGRIADLCRMWQNGNGSR